MMITDDLGPGLVQTCPSGRLYLNGRLELFFLAGVGLDVEEKRRFDGKRIRQAHIVGGPWIQTPQVVNRDRILTGARGRPRGDAGESSGHVPSSY